MFLLKNYLYFEIDKKITIDKTQKLINKMIKHIAVFFHRGCKKSNLIKSISNEENLKNEIWRAEE